jgi:hypothetical protein
MKTKAHIIYKLADDSRVPGCTTICGILDKPALLEWANRIGLQGIEMRRYVDDKADIGTLAHDMIVCHLKEETCDTSDYSKNQIEQAENAMLSFLEWEKGHEIKLCFAEKPFVSETYRYGGMIDVYAVVDGVEELIDFKTGSGIYPEHILQVGGGYRLLLEDNGACPDRIRILNIPRTNNENWGEVVVGKKQMELNGELFLTCLKAYNLRKMIKNEVVYASKHEGANLNLKRCASD